MFSEGGLCELILVVKDVRASAKFYQEVVHLIPEKEPTDEGACFWTGRPSKARRLTLRKADGSGGAVQFALNVPREKFVAAIAHVKSCGIEVSGPSRDEERKAESVHFFDPDGNQVELWSPEPPPPSNIHNANPFLQPKRWV